MVKNVVLVIGLIFSFQSFAFSLQFGTGSITPHFVTRKKSYCNQWNNTGIIVNKTYYIRMLHEKYGIGSSPGWISPLAGKKGLLPRVKQFIGPGDRKRISGNKPWA